MTQPSREMGYAMIAAVATAAFFAYVAVAATESARSDLTSARAEADRAKLSADADAGIALAVHGLGLSDPAQRWRLAGEHREIAFDGATMAISVEDEAGKVPLNFVFAPQIRRLFLFGGAEPAQADALSAELLDLRDGADRPGGSGRPEDTQQAAHGPLASLDELATLKGMTPALYARIAPVTTVTSPVMRFDLRTASSLAVAVMTPNLADTPALIEAQRAQAGERAVFDDIQAIPLAGRMLTVRVDVADGHGAGMQRTAVVELTGAPARPYLVRSLD